MGVAAYGTLVSETLYPSFLSSRTNIPYASVYLSLHILCTKLMVTESYTQYQINGYQLRMSHCYQGTLLPPLRAAMRWYLSLKNVFLVRGVAHAAFVITAFTCLFPWVTHALFLPASRCFRKKDPPKKPNTSRKENRKCQNLSLIPNPQLSWCWISISTYKNTAIKFCVKIHIIHKIVNLKIFNYLFFSLDKTTLIL